MAEAISLISATIGIADVCIRLSKELIDVVSRFQGAPEKIQKLQRRIGELTGIFDQIHTLGQHYNSLPSSPSTVGSFQHIHRTIASCKENLGTFERLLAKSHGVSGSMIAKTRMRIKFALNDRECSRIIEQIEADKTALLTAMSAIGL
jgi:STAND-like protein